MVDKIPRIHLYWFCQNSCWHQCVSANCTWWLWGCAFCVIYLSFYLQYLAVLCCLETSAWLNVTPSEYVPSWNPPDKFTMHCSPLLFVSSELLSLISYAYWSHRKSSCTLEFQTLKQSRRALCQTVKMAWNLHSRLWSVSCIQNKSYSHIKCPLQKTNRDHLTR